MSEPAPYTVDRATHVLCWLLFGLAVALSLLDAVLYVYAPTPHDLLITEDGLVENLSFFFSLLASLYILTTLGVRTGRFYYVVLAAGLLLLAGEEISWGQRIFQIAEPGSLQAINQQGELNLHNIRGVHQHIKAVGLSAILLFAVGIPLLYRLSKPVARLIERLRLPLFPWQGTALIAFATILMTAPRLLVNDTPMDEVGELLIATAFLIFALLTPNKGLVFTGRKPRAA